MGFDLTLLSHPGSTQVRSDGDSVVNALEAVEPIARFCEVTPMSSAPSDIDTMSLDDAISSGDFSADDFVTFCRRRGLTPNQHEPQSAAAFLDSKWGVTFVSVKMPHTESEAKAAYRALVEFARANKLRLGNTYTGRDVDLATPGELPTGW